MTGVARLPLSDSYTVEQALGAADGLGFREVLIVGTGEDGRVSMVTSKMTRKDALWLAEEARLHALGLLR